MNQTPYKISTQSDFIQGKVEDLFWLGVDDRHTDALDKQALKGPIDILDA